VDVSAVTPTVLGIDLSSFQLNGCLLVPGQSPILRSQILFAHKTDNDLERLRYIPEAMRMLTTQRLTIGDRIRYVTPDYICIEDSFGKGNTRKVLDRVTGAVLACCPRESQISVVDTQTWRSALGAANRKEDGHRAVAQWYAATYGVRFGADSHELDACGIALAWQRILASNEAAA
jgi:hypothetical protein